MMAKCQGPAPLGVGTITANVPPTNVTDAGIFALIVHGIQTFLVVLLGVYVLAALPFTNRHRA